MGRPKLWTEAVTISLPRGAKAAIDAVLKKDEGRSEMIREAIDKEIASRGGTPPKSN